MCVLAADHGNYVGAFDACSCRGFPAARHCLGDRGVSDRERWVSQLIPNRRPGAVKRAERSDRVIWETVKKLAARAGVVAHLHALRAAFAVQFDEANLAQVAALKELLGHPRTDQTLVYLRRKNKAKAMEVVRDLSWGGAGHYVFPPSEMAARKSPR
jgi:integrase